MKSLLLSAILLVFLLRVSTVYSQDNSDNSQGTLLGKGTWLFDLYKPLKFSSYKDEYTGTSNKYSDFSLNLQTGYFFHDRMGVGLGIDFGSSMSDITYKQITNTFRVMGNYYQGYNLFGMEWLAKAGVGFGSEKITNKLNNTEEHLGLARLKLETGPLLKVFNDQPFLLYPTAGILYDRTKYSTYTENTTNFSLGADLIFNLGCSQFSTDCKNGDENLHLRTASGINTFSASTMGFFKIGGISEKYSTLTYKYSTNRQALDLDYSHFIMDGFSVGGWTMITHQFLKQKDSPTSGKTSSTDFLIGPLVTGYLPFGKYLDNIYLGMDLGIGARIQNYYTSKTTDREIGSMIKAGYDYGLSGHLSLIPQIGYGYFYFKNSSNNTHYAENSLYTSIGMRTSF